MNATAELMANATDGASSLLNGLQTVLFAETANASIEASGGQWLTDIFFPTLVERTTQLVAAPFQHREMIYILMPMLITLVLMEFYFGRYEDEELGWNTAVGHALVLVFVGIDLLKTVHPGVAPGVMMTKALGALSQFSSVTGEALTTLIATLILLFGLLLLIVDFFHWLPKGLAFFVSGGLQIDIVAYLGIVIVYSHNAKLDPVPIDWYTLLAAIILFLGLWAFFGFVHLLEPKVWEKRNWEKRTRKRRGIRGLDDNEKGEPLDETGEGSLGDRAPRPER